LGGCDDLCSLLWPLCGAKYINAANSPWTHTQMAVTPHSHDEAVSCSQTDTLVESALSFFPVR